MTWLRLDDQFHRHRKVAPLKDHEWRLHVTAMLECSNQLTDGRIDDDVIPTLPQAPSGKRLKDAIRNLEKRGLWEKDGDAWIIHDFLDWNPSAAEVLEKREQAKERMRKAREANDKKRAEKQEKKRRQNDKDGSQHVRANTKRTEEEQTEKFDQPRSRSRSLDPPSTPPEGGEPPEDLQIPCPSPALPSEVFEELAGHYQLDVHVIREGEKSFKNYWIAGKGAGKRFTRGVWMVKCREWIRRAVESGELKATTASPEETPWHN